MHHAYLDKFADRDSIIHRIDPRAKLVATIVFIVAVISVSRMEVLSLVPFALFPFGLIALAGVPVRYIVKHCLIVSPFALAFAIFLPIFDRETYTLLAGIPISKGTVQAINVLLKFFLTISATLTLTSTTRFDRLLQGLGSMGVPRVMVVQLSFLYRYLFVLVGEGLRMRMAHESRCVGHVPIRIRLRAVGGIISTLFLRTLERAEGVYNAMVSRGFDGEVRTLSQMHFRIADAAFLLVSAVFCLGLRMVIPV